MISVTRDMINKTCRRRYREIPTPQWLQQLLDFGAVTWRIQSVTDKERNAIDIRLLGKDGEVDRNLRLFHKANWVVVCLVDDEGNRLYSDDEAAQVANLDSTLVDWLFDQIAEHCGISASDLEELEKNFEQTETSDCLLSV